MTSTPHDHSHNKKIAKSVGILNAYGEMATLMPQDQEIGGAISSQLNKFHRNEPTNRGEDSTAIQTLTTPQTMRNRFITQQMSLNSPHTDLSGGKINHDFHTISQTY